jgi:ABC-2 type transport system permease protein
LLYLALFTPLLNATPLSRSLSHAAHVNTLDFFLPGILALLAFGTGAGMGFGTIFELQAGVVERFRVTPTSRLALLLGPLVSGVVWMFVFDAILVGVGAAFGFHVHIGGLLVLAVLLALFMVAVASFSVAMALVTKEISAFAAVINGINLPVLLLAGVLLPISIGPEWMKIVAHFNPLYYLVVGARSLAVGSFSGGATWQAFAVLAPLCGLMLAWATTVMRRAVA